MKVQFPVIIKFEIVRKKPSLWKYVSHKLKLHFKILRFTYCSFSQPISQDLVIVYTVNIFGELYIVALKTWEQYPYEYKPRVPDLSTQYLNPVLLASTGIFIWVYEYSYGYLNCKFMLNRTRQQPPCEQRAINN